MENKMQGSFIWDEHKDAENQNYWSWFLAKRKKIL